MLRRVRCCQKRCGAALLRRRDNRFRKTGCRGTPSTCGRRRCISTTPFCSIAQSNSVALLHSSHRPILRAGLAVPPRRCPAFWSDPRNRDNYVLSCSGWKQRFSIHGPSHIATKHSFRFPASHPAASALHFSLGATGQQWWGSRFADNTLYLAAARSNRGSRPRGSAYRWYSARHAPFHIATKFSSRFPVSHPAASALHFSPGPTGRQVPDGSQSGAGAGSR